MFKVELEDTKSGATYSYKVREYELTVGQWNVLDKLPEDIVGELEVIVQSDNCPAFALDPNSVLVIKVTKE